MDNLLQLCKIFILIWINGLNQVLGEEKHHQELMILLIFQKDKMFYLMLVIIKLKSFMLLLLKEVHLSLMIQLIENYMLIILWQIEEKYKLVLKKIHFNINF